MISIYCFFYPLQTNDIADFEIGIRFLDELGQYYLDVKQKDIKHAIAGLLVEILLPIAAVRLFVLFVNENKFLVYWSV